MTQHMERAIIVRRSLIMPDMLPHCDTVIVISGSRRRNLSVVYGMTVVVLALQSSACGFVKSYSLRVAQRSSIFVASLGTVEVLSLRSRWKDTFPPDWLDSFVSTPRNASQWSDHAHSTWDKFTLGAVAGCRSAAKHSRGVGNCATPHLTATLRHSASFEKHVLEGQSRC
jgi:hypothetical protein